jgi:hypothetical protein
MSAQCSSTGLSARDIAERILALQGTLDLSNADWQQDDVHWWPLYRTELYRLMFASDAGTRGSAGSAHIGPALHRIRREHPAVSPGAVWLVSDGVSYANVGARRVDRFCSPLFASCRREGVPAVVIDRAGAAGHPAEELTRWWAPWTLRAKAMGVLHAHVSLSDRHSRLVNSVAQVTAALGLNPQGLQPKRMQAMANAVLSLSERLERVMRDERARAVFVVSFYDVAGYAYTLAAARAGIPSVDVQHGVTGQHHLAYAHWPAALMPWRLLPQWFWTWTDADASVIEAWASNGTHRAIHGGNPFMDAWREGVLEIDATQQWRLQALRECTGSRKPVLVTLQPGLMHAEALEPLLTAMKQSKNTYWWLRLHPMSLGGRPQLEALLASLNISNFDIDSATAIPLPALLPKCALHATHSSSAFIEAAALNIPSVVWSRYGAELAEGAIAEGSTHAALDGPSLAALVDSGVAIATTSASESTRGRDALRTILESCPS